HALVGEDDVDGPAFQDCLRGLGGTGRDHVEVVAQQGRQGGENVRLIVNDQQRAFGRAHKGLPSHALETGSAPGGPEGAVPPVIVIAHFSGGAKCPSAGRPGPTPETDSTPRRTTTWRDC